MTEKEEITVGLKLILECLSNGKIIHALRIVRFLLEKFGKFSQAVDDAFIEQLKNEYGVKD